MQYSVEQVAGIEDWPKQDVVFSETDSAIIRAEELVAEIVPLFLKDALMDVEEMAATCRQFRNRFDCGEEETISRLQFMRMRAGHLNDVCLSYGMVLAGQVSDSLSKRLNRPLVMSTATFRAIQSHLLMLETIFRDRLDEILESA